jgi:hypothetical protein
MTVHIFRVEGEICQQVPPKLRHPPTNLQVVVIVNIFTTVYTLILKIYRVIQEERSIFWEVMVSVIVGGKIV